MNDESFVGISSPSIRAMIAVNPETPTPRFDFVETSEPAPHTRPLEIPPSTELRGCPQPPRLHRNQFTPKDGAITGEQARMPRERPGCGLPTGMHLSYLDKNNR